MSVVSTSGLNGQCWVRINVEEDYEHWRKCVSRVTRWTQWTVLSKNKMWKRTMSIGGSVSVVSPGGLNGQC